MGGSIVRRFDVDELLREYDGALKPQNGRLIRLSGIDDMDGYNPSGVIPNSDQPHVYVRVEYRDDEFSSWSVPFRQTSENEWSMEPELPMLSLQDPSVAIIGGKIVVGGVRVVAKKRDYVYFRTVLWRGDSVDSLQEFVLSPLQMKDTRLVELSDGRVGIFTRPMGGAAGKGKIAYTEADSLDVLTPGVMDDAKWLDVQPVDAHWWGANDIYALGGDHLGILGHVAKLEGKDRHYYAFAAVFDRQTRTIVDGPRIIANRASFPATVAKRADLQDIVFPSSIDRKRGLLYAGLSDSAIGVVSIPDPFAE